MANSMIYRIYTEFLNLGGIERIAQKYFAAFTVYHVWGLYNHTREQSVVIEIIAGLAEGAHVRALAREIQVLNNQETVLCTATPTTVEIVQAINPTEEN